MSPRNVTDLPLWYLLRHGHEPALIREPDRLRIALITSEPYTKQIREVLKQNQDATRFWLQVYLPAEGGFVYRELCTAGGS